MHLLVLRLGILLYNRPFHHMHFPAHQVLGVNQGMSGLSLKLA